MITNFKIFENLNQGEVEIGDYIVINTLDSNGIYFETEQLISMFDCVLVFLHVDDFKSLEDELNVEDHYIELGNDSDVENEEYPIVVLVIGNDEKTSYMEEIIKRDDISSFVDFEGIRERILNTKKFNV